MQFRFNTKQLLVAAGTTCLLASCGNLQQATKRLNSVHNSPEYVAEVRAKEAELTAKMEAAHIKKEGKFSDEIHGITDPIEPGGVLVTNLVQLLNDELKPTAIIKTENLPRGVIRLRLINETGQVKDSVDVTKESASEFEKHRREDLKYNKNLETLSLTTFVLVTASAVLLLLAPIWVVLSFGGITGFLIWKLRKPK